MPLLAAIDVGSNTLRLLIGRVGDGGIIDVFSDRKITRLGNRVAETGKLQDENIEASISALKEFSSAISKYEVRRVKAVATSAVREASNSDAFIKRVFEVTGIPVEIIPGEREAELTLKGILAAFPGTGGRIMPASVLILDIGGGSTEWVLYRAGARTEMGSIPVGVIKLAQKFLKTDPLTDADLDRINREIAPHIDYLKKNIDHLISERARLIGTAGTFTTIASIDLALEAYSREKIHLHTISLSGLQILGKKLATLSLKDRKSVKGLEPERADLIIPGVQFTINVMESLGFDELTISDYGLLEGVLLDIGKGISETGQP